MFMFTSNVREKIQELPVFTFFPVLKFISKE